MEYVMLLLIILMYMLLKKTNVYKKLESTSKPNSKDQELEKLVTQLEAFSYLNQRIFKRFEIVLQKFLSTSKIEKLIEYQHRMIRYLNDIKMHIENDLYKEVELINVIDKLDNYLMIHIQQNAKQKGEYFHVSQSRNMKGYNSFEILK